MRNYIVVLVSLLLPVLFGSCGGGGGGGEGLPWEQRETALEEVSQQFASLQDQPPDTANQALAEWLSTRPEFEAAGVSEDQCVWARFTDGRLLIVVNNREPNQEQAASLPAGQPGRAASELPSDASVLFYNSLGTNFVTPASSLALFATANGYGGGMSTGAVDELKGVQGNGVFYMDAHGGTGQLRDGTMVFAVWTGTAASNQGDVTYRQDLDDGSLAYMIAAHNLLPNGIVTQENHYGITSTFVRNYMAFGEDSLVFINACSSDNADFKSACFDLQRPASAYMGWTEPVDDGPANTAALYVFDRLLGSNAYPAHPENPPQRPFDWASVWQDMKDQGLDVGSAAIPPARLIVTANPNLADTFALLAPSIERMEVNESDLPDGSELVIYGSFGSAQGTVTVNGVDVAVKSWAPEKIVCALPNTGDAVAGDVVVTARGHKSNVLQLTEWWMQFRYLWEARDSDWYDILSGDLRLTATWNVHLRTDCHDRRVKPHEQPLPQMGRILRPMADSDCTFDATGTVTCWEHISGPMYSVTWSRNGSTTLPLFTGADLAPALATGADLPDRCWGFLAANYTGDVNLPARFMYVRLIARAADGIFETWSYNSSAWDQTSEFLADIIHPGAGTQTFLPYESYNIEFCPLEFDANYDIRKGSSEVTTTRGPTDFGSFRRVEWDDGAGGDIIARFPPKPDAARLAEQN